MTRPKFISLNKWNEGNIGIEPKNGLLVMFPSFLSHYVQPNMSDKERIMVSFNLNLLHNSNVVMLFTIYHCVFEFPVLVYRTLVILYMLFNNPFHNTIFFFFSYLSLRIISFSFYVAIHP